MKRILLLIALIAASAADAREVVKETFVYSVRGADTLRLDRYAAFSDDDRPKPCLLFAFGGGFFTGTRDNDYYGPFFEYYARRGWCVVSIDYRLGMKAAVEAQRIDDRNVEQLFTRAVDMAVEDLYDATAYVLANATTWGVDPARIVTSGSSAGAITVLTGEYLLRNGGPQARVLPRDFEYAGVVAFAGAILSRSGELEWATPPAPMMLFHGDGDRNVPYGAVRSGGLGFFGSGYIARRLTEKGVPHWFYSAANDDHSLSARPMTENLYQIDAFLEKMVLGRQPLIVDTYVTLLGAPELPDEFTMSDYMRANFIREGQ